MEQYLTNIGYFSLRWEMFKKKPFTVLQLFPEGAKLQAKTTNKTITFVSRIFSLSAAIRFGKVVNFKILHKCCAQWLCFNNNGIYFPHLQLYSQFHRLQWMCKNSSAELPLVLHYTGYTDITQHNQSRKKTTTVSFLPIFLCSLGQLHLCKTTTGH